MATSLDMTPGVLDVTVYSGDSTPMNVTLSGVDLTGATISAQLRTSPEVSAYTVLPVTPVNLAAGSFTVDLGAVVSGYYDVQVIAAGVTRTYLRGRINVMMDVTR